MARLAPYVDEMNSKDEETTSGASKDLSSRCLLGPIRISTAGLSLGNHFVHLNGWKDHIQDVSAFAGRFATPMGTSGASREDMLAINHSVSARTCHFRITRVPMEGSSLPSKGGFVQRAHQRVRIRRKVLVPRVLRLNMIFHAMFRLPSP